MAWRRVGALSKLILTVRGDDIELENWTGCNFPVAVEETSIFANATSGGMYGESAVQSYNPSLYAEMSGYANGVIDLDLYASVLNDGENMYLWRPETGRSTCIRFIKDANNRKFDARMEISGQYIGYNNVYYNDQSLWPYMPAHHSGFTFILNDEGGANLVGGYWFQDQYNAQNFRYAMNFQWKAVSDDPYTQACIMSLILGQEVTPPEPGGDPYEPGGTSTSGGGENATFDLTSDDIDIPSLPSISASGAGLLTLYQVSLQNMSDFASYLWSPLFDVDTLKKLFNDPMDAIISLGMLPFTPTGGTVSNIFIGTSDSGVSATRLVSQYYEIDMGSVLLDTFYDSALDLNPYTKVELYLPYCGTVSINPDEFDGKSIHVVYHVDILTGACVVFVEDGSRVLVQSQGNILTAIPYTAKDFKSIFGAVLGDAAAAGAAIGALATGGISAVAGGIGLVSHVALNTVNSKVNTPHGGQCASTAGFLSIQKPYLIITRPAQCLPEDNAAYQGYPAYITETVGNLTGFIKISEAHFDGFTCTDGELKEIDRLLKEGVYVQ